MPHHCISSKERQFAENGVFGNCPVCDDRVPIFPIMYGPPRDCKGGVWREDKSAQMYSSIRAKALSRAKFSCPLL